MSHSPGLAIPTDAEVGLPSEDLIKEQAYLVARGVRPMCLLGCIEADPLLMLTVATRIETLALYESGVIPFVLDRQDGGADYGYASAKWVLDLYSWLERASDDSVPALQKDRLRGLLLGYSADAIRQFEESGRSTSVGRMFRSPTASLESAPS